MKNEPPSPALRLSELDRLAALGKALSSPARLRILALLREQPLCVCQIRTVLGLAPSTVSTHLRELHHTGLLTERKDGKWVEYGVSEHPAARDWLATLWSRLENDRQIRRDRRIAAAVARLDKEDVIAAGTDLARLGIPSIEEGSRIDD